MPLTDKAWRKAFDDFEVKLSNLSSAEDVSIECQKLVVLWESIVFHHQSNIYPLKSEVYDELQQRHQELKHKCLQRFGELIATGK